MQPIMQRRQNEFEGYVLEPHGATFGQAIRTHDIGIPSYREQLRKAGLEQITQDNGNGRVRELRTTPPSRETCQHLVDVLAERRAEALREIEATIKAEDAELKDSFIGRDEKSFIRTRLQGLREKRRQIIAEAEVTADDLYQFFRKEDIDLRSRLVAPEIRESLSILAEEQEFARVG